MALVPTMGALHEGHLRLVDAARADCDTLVVSLFVNPAQFGPGEDLARYPRTLAADTRRCRAAGVDVLFAPRAGDMYPSGFCTRVEIAGPARRLEGKIRPGHFSGVATIVLKLFQIVRPEVALFGQKDAQQVAVVRRLVRDLDLPVRIHVAPTLRAADGVAHSSRNRFLGARERQRARTLHAALRAAAELYARGERRCAALRRAMRRPFAGARGTRLEYAEVVDAESFEPLVRADRGRALLVIAARVGSVRLIDNLSLPLPA